MAGHGGCSFSVGLHDNARMRAKPVTAVQAYPKIRAIIRKIPKGKVASYAQVAYLAGFPGRARLVGRALSDPTIAAKVPWHRVINAQGKLALPKSSESYLEQKARLTAEGVTFSGDRVSFQKYGWRRDFAPVLE